MNLLGVELRRLWARQLVRMLVATSLLVMLVAGVVTFATHRPEPPDVGEVDALIAEEVAACRQYAAAEWEDFAETGVAFDEEYGAYMAQFESSEAWADEQCQPGFFGFYIEEPRFCLVSLYERRERFDELCPDIGSAATVEFSEEGAAGDPERNPDPGGRGIVPAVGLLVLGLAAILGSSFIGAEYKEGTIETTLLWDTRRRRVLGAKLAAVAIGGALLHIVVMAALVVAMLPAGLWRGSTAGVDTAFWAGLAGTVLRGGAVAAAYAVIAASVATLARNTAGGVAVLLGYVAVSPLLTSTLLPSLRPRDLVVNSMAATTGGEVGKFVDVVLEGTTYQSEVVSHGTVMAMGHVAVYVAVFVVVALVVFARRDVD